MMKDHILSEIRRTAKENGGKPYGSDRFLSETGIKEADWRGKYWIRWGDALTEAGFDRNTWGTGYKEEDQLSRLAALARELGHFPLFDELKMKRHADPQFPSEQTYRRFGGKKKLASRLRAFCVGRGENDIAAMCDTALAEVHPNRSALTEGERASEELSFVYLMKSGRFYKIGRTNALGRRERELVIQLPDKAKVVHSIKTDDPNGIEEYWHRRFAARRRNGEWFELEPGDVSAFKRRKFM